MLNSSLIFALLTLLIGLFATPGAAQPKLVSVKFASTNAVMTNPERGLVGWAGDLADVWEDGILAEAKRGYSTQRAHIRLDAFRDIDLPASFLIQLNRGFDAVRQAGVKVIPRFVYNSPPPSSTYWLVAKDAKLNQVIRHIEQLAPVLGTHQDVIAYIEAGFIGAWGEWHSSSNGLTKPGAKAQIKDALDQHFPKQRFIMFRTPRDLRSWHANPNAASAHRFGFHNDCFLANATDANTYTQPSDRDYAKKLTRWAPFGGETCAIGTRSSCASILSEGRQYHLTWLNRFGDLKAFSTVWKREGCYRQVINQMGYRFELLSFEHQAQVKTAQTATFSLSVRNSGWSKLHNARKLVLHWIRLDKPLEQRSEINSVQAEQWLPNANDLHIRFDITAPGPGVYRLALSLPDKAQRLTGDARYAIKFANADQRQQEQYWDAGRGVFFVGTQVTVTN